LPNMSRNVILIALDSVRRDLSVDEMSSLYSSADYNILCRAASSWSVPAHGSLLTGLLPSEHGVHANNINYKEMNNTFLDEVSSKTIGMSANSYASTTFGFDKYFDVFRDVRPNRYFDHALDVNEWLGSDIPLWKKIIENDESIRSIANVSYLGLKHLTQQLPMPGLIDEGMKRQLRLFQQYMTEEPFFIFANIMEAHRPMFQHIGLDKKYASYKWSSRSVDKWEINTCDQPNVEYRSYLNAYRDLYRGSLRYMDRQISELISDIQALTNRETTVIVTADHGEGLAYPRDDNIIDHVGIFNDSVLNVPFLIFNSPGEFDPEFISHLDLPQIIIAFSQGKTPDIDRDWAPSETIGSMGTPEENQSWWNRTSRALWRPTESYTWDSVSGTTPPDIAEKYFNKNINKYSGGSETDFDDATESQLESLGYL